MISQDLEYENYSDFKTVGKKDFENFIEQYYSILEVGNLSGLKGKEEYLDSFEQNLNSIVLYSSLAKRSLNYLYKNTDVKITKEIQSFYLINEGELKEKTLVYYPMPHIDFLLNIRIIEDLVKKFVNNYNIVIVDNTISFFNEKTYTKEEYDTLLSSEITEFFSENSLTNTEKIFNTICYGSLFLFDVLCANPDLYDQLIMYAPMLSLLENGDYQQKVIQLNPSTFPCEDNMINYSIYTYLTQTISGSKITPFIVSKNNLSANFTNFKTIYKQFSNKEIKDLDSLNNPKMILAENDSVILHENSLSNYASDSKVLANADHVDFLVFPETRKAYLAYLEELIS